MLYIKVTNTLIDPHIAGLKLVKEAKRVKES